MMRRALGILALGVMFGLSTTAAAQSPGPFEGTAVDQDLCVHVVAPIGVDAATLTAGVIDGSMVVTEVSPCETVTTPEPSPEATTDAAAIDYQKLSSRDWKRLVKDPDSHVAEGVQVWACISQFDSGTGSDAFRGQALNKRTEYWYTDGENAVFSGDAAQLADFVEDDIVLVKAIVAGSLEYETTIGGTQTVPMFMVQSIQHKGSCE